MLQKFRNMEPNNGMNIGINNGVKTVALGIGALILAPTVFALLKPVAKAAIKTGVVLYTKGRETLAETSEQVADLVAEAKAEVLAEQNSGVNSTAIVPAEQPKE